MKSFKQFLKEEPEVDIEYWFKRWGTIYLNSAIIEADNSVSFLLDKPIIIIQNDLLNSELPFQLNKVQSIMIKDATFSSFRNFPRIIAGPITLQSNYKAISLANNSNSSFNNISSLEGITPILPGAVELDFCHNLNYSRVNKHLKEVDNIISISHKYIGPILDFLNIKKLSLVYQLGNSDLPLENALYIITKHLQGDRDILDCQEELIQAGLREYAKL